MGDASAGHWVAWAAEKVDPRLPVWTMAAHLVPAAELDLDPRNFWKTRRCHCQLPTCCLVSLTVDSSALYPSQLSADVAIRRLLKRLDLP